MDNHGEMLIYQTEDGLTKIDVSFENDTVWLSKSQMAELFQRDRSVISKHIKNVFAEGELSPKSNVQNLHVAHSDKPIDFYSLDVIISVGYRVKSRRGVQFRIWATNILKEYIKKGFAMDDNRLKELGGGGYFKELLSSHILCTAFENTSSEYLLGKIDGVSKVVLKNNKEISTQQLKDILSKRDFDYVFSFGQRPNIKNKIHIERLAKRNENILETNYDLSKLKSVFEEQNIIVKISENAGTSYCNHIYFSGLECIKGQSLKTKMIFIHIPMIENMTSQEEVFRKINEAIHIYTKY